MNRILTIIALVSVTGLALWGMQMPVSMDGGDMMPCPFMTDHAVVCDMAPLAHFEVWQSFFLIVVQTGVVLMAVALAAFFSLRILDHLDQFLRRRRFSLVSQIEYHFYSYFSWLFSDGILQPKLYAW